MVMATKKQLFRGALRYYVLNIGLTYEKEND